MRPWLTWAAGRNEAGAFVTITMQDDLGKLRPALVLQAEHLDEHATVTVLPVTSTTVGPPLLRISVRPDASNGLQNLPRSSWTIYL